MTKMGEWLLGAAFAGGVLTATPMTWAQNSNPPARVGRIAGNLDGVSQDGDHYLLSGWACQQGQTKSIAVQLFVEQPAGSAGKLAPFLAETANLYSEPAVNQACQDRQGGKHRFLIVLPYGYGPDSHLAVHGLRIVDGVPNDAIAGSDAKLRLLAGPSAPYPALPGLAGAYRKLDHPGVFTSAAELKDLVLRINRTGSYSMRRFELLAAQIKHDLAADIDWDVTYSGANGGVYQFVFSYEPQDHHEAETRAALTIPPDAKAPAGAAVMAARLSLYATLVKMGATPPAGAPSADPAVQLAKRILLAWADHGFRRPDGKFLTLADFARDGHGRPAAALGLELGRGVVYSVHAQDLLQSVGTLNGDEVRRLKAFHDTLFNLIRQSSNVFFAGVGFPYSECSRYTNIATNAVASLLATARLLDDERRFTAILDGGDNSIPALVPWQQLFDHIIYGQGDGPPPGCVHNLDPDSLTGLANHHDYQTAAAAPGEISDRFRNFNSGQSFGYTMFTLERLIDSAEILRFAGFEPYLYRGVHQQSIEMAMQYYACYAKGAGFYKVVTPENSRACPNAAQYYGKLVSSVDRMVLIGAYRFPENATITAVEFSAKTVAASPGAFTNDAILFGKWRD